MAWKNFLILFSVFAFKFCSCQRRITHGKSSENGRRYMVYLLNSHYSEIQPRGWLCGGALVTDQHILTLASCLTEVKYMYAIAGYKKYVSSQNIDGDNCTQKRKQRIVTIIIPKGFKKDDSNPEERMKFDVGLAVVEKRYNFSDESYRLDCSYPPMKIFPNYNKMHETPNTVASVFGWGGTGARNLDEKEDLNAQYLREAKTVITNTSFCAHYVSDNLKPVLYSSFLCAFGSGYSSRSDGQRYESDLLFDNCLWRRFNLNDSENYECTDAFESRRKGLLTELGTGMRRRHNSGSDAGGICENDRGGPLVSYFGTSEVLIGIAVTSIHTSLYACEGPFLYIGIAKMGALIKCLLAENDETRSLCSHLSNEADRINIKWPGDETPETTRQVSKTWPYKQVTIKESLEHTSKEITHIHTAKHINKQSKVTYKPKSVPMFTPMQVEEQTQKHDRNNLRIRSTIADLKLSSHRRTRAFSTEYIDDLT